MAGRAAAGSRGSVLARVSSLLGVECGCEALGLDLYRHRKFGLNRWIKSGRKGRRRRQTKQRVTNERVDDGGKKRRSFG